jgi:hypothetical protein
MLRRTDITSALGAQALTRRHVLSRAFGAAPPRYVVCGNPRTPSVLWPLAVALVGVLAVGTALANGPPGAWARIAALRKHPAGAPVASPAARSVAPAPAAPEAAACAAVDPDEPELFVVTTRAGRLPQRDGAGVRPELAPQVERTFEVAVARGPAVGQGGSEALVEFGRGTGRVSDPRSGAFDVSSRQPLPSDPGRRRIAAWITAPGASEIALRLDAAGRIVEIKGLDAVRRQAAVRTRDEALRPVVAAALDEATIRTLLEGVVRGPESPGGAGSEVVGDAGAAEPARAHVPSDRPTDPVVRRVGAWPSELE